MSENEKPYLLVEWLDLGSSLYLITKYKPSVLNHPLRS
jgi:hypothetical protein